MGVCASSQNSRRRRSPPSSLIEAANSISLRPVPSSSTSKLVIDVDGNVQELKQPIQAKQVTSQHPNCFLCSSESMSVGTLVPFVPDEEYLQPGQIYFLLPSSQARQPLSLPDLCLLAIKASSALDTGAVDFSSSGNSKFNLR